MMDQFHGGATLVFSFPEPNSGLVAFAVYISHERDLMTSFLNVRLVDAECIEPSERTQQVTDPRQILGCAMTLINP